MICEYCESQISNQCTVCPVCGNPVEKKETSKTSEVSNPKNKLLIVLGTVSLVLVSVILVLLCIILKDKVLLSKPTTTLVPEITQTPLPEPTPQVIIVTQEPIYITPEPIVDNSVKTRMYIVNCEEWVSLRTSPSTSSTRIIKIPLGDPVGFISTASNGFYKVEYNGSIGYVLAEYLSNNYSYRNSAQIYYTVVNCEEWISLRTAPSTSASKIATIPLGASVQYIANSSNGFYKVKYNGQTGYALSKYLN